MTAQVSDQIVFDGRQYRVMGWKGNVDCIPSSKALGFQTVTLSTDNCSGRIDHYGVWGGELYLFKIDATLENPAATATPPNARREVLFRYEQFYDFKGRPSELREYRHDFFVYEDLKLPFTGRVIALAADDPWERPQAAPEGEQGRLFAIEFENGVVVDSYDLDE